VKPALKMWLIILLLAFAYLGAWVSWDKALDLLNQKSDLDVAYGWGILISILCLIGGTVHWIWTKIRTQQGIQRVMHRDIKRIK
jgi:hypothetical protein